MQEFTKLNFAFEHLFVRPLFPLWSVHFFDLLTATCVSWKLQFIDTCTLELLFPYAVIFFESAFADVCEMTIFFIAYISTTYL